MDGITITPVSNGLQALSVAKTEKPDLLLLDIQLPSMDGITITNRLNAHPATQDIRILPVTALAMPDELKRILEAGCDAALTRPLTQNPFITAVTTLVSEPVPV
jgi:two-component system cell cycle response regulator DivK